MDFFERQDRARANTKLLVAYFVTGVAALIVVVYLAVVLIFSGMSLGEEIRPGYAPPRQAGLWQPQLFLGVALGTLAVVSMGSLFKMAELSQGGASVASMLGGELVNPGTSDAHERRLLNVVEEMALASGVPVPKVYVMPREQGINAFAAGRSNGDAVIGVTDGCMRLLSRDELQGVIAHEFSHILNGDMRLNMRLIGLIFGIISLAVIGRVLLYTRGGDRDRNVLPLLGLALIIIGWVGVLFGRLIQAAVSRQREYLADASAVQFTRNPQGLAGALKKIGALSQGSRVENPHAEEVSHMFFGSGYGRSLSGAFATHPPLEARIRALEPEFDGRFPKLSEAARPASSRRDLPPRAREHAGAYPFAGVAPALTPPPVIKADDLMEDLGAPEPPHLRYAQEMRETIPAVLRRASEDPLGACALVFGLVLSRDPATRDLELSRLGQTFSPAIVRETLRLQAAVREASARAKLPLVDLCLPALRDLSPAQFQRFRESLKMLVETDGQIDLFEYVLQRVVVRHLEPHFLPVKPPAIEFYSQAELATEISVLLSALAHSGQSGGREVAAAFEQGARTARAAGPVNLQLLPPGASGLSQIDAALDRLCRAVPQVKKNVLNAVAQAVAADGVILEVEAELLRAIADTLDCPVPPFADPASA